MGERARGRDGRVIPTLVAAEINNLVGHSVSGI